MYYDRYKQFNENNKSFIVPMVTIDESSEDKQIVYSLGHSRLDVISQEYYGEPYYGWLILLANPQYGGLEFNIPDREIIRIPFPLATALSDYDNKIATYITLYGRE